MLQVHILFLHHLTDRNIFYFHFDFQNVFQNSLFSTMEQELESSEEVEHLLRFLRNVERGICRGRKD